MKIAGYKTVEQWEELEQTLKNNDNAGWDCAFEFFEERMETRYLRPIEIILAMEIKGEGEGFHEVIFEMKFKNKSKYEGVKFNGEGFAVVSLLCSLIETIECFIRGAISHTNGKTIWKDINGKEIFKYGSAIFNSFFSNREPFKNLNIDGSDFYKSVRCGLLHETQTKNDWEIRSDISSEEKSFVGKTIYRENLHFDIRNLIGKYKLAILEGKDFDEIKSEDLRQNFRDKFNHICEISKAK